MSLHCLCFLGYRHDDAGDVYRSFAQLFQSVAGFCQTIPRGFLGSFDFMSTVKALISSSELSQEVCLATKLQIGFISSFQRPRTDRERAGVAWTAIEAGLRSAC